ncbi:MAG TPA: NnrS family protein, partial [Caulobacteraceae bacterium]|nr:NnrS family protein [Caulobacteraceae bacterium]
RGHTGRPLTADTPTMLVYLAVLCAAGLRVAAPFAGALTPGLLTASAGLWLLAFGGFAVSYWSMLTGPRPAAAAHG